MLHADYEDSTTNLKRHAKLCQPPETVATEMITSYTSRVLYSPSRMRYLIGGVPGATTHFPLSKTRSFRRFSACCTRRSACPHSPPSSRISRWSSTTCMPVLQSYSQCILAVVESPAPPLLGSAYTHQNSAQTPQHPRSTSASASLPLERLTQRLFSIINLAGPPLPKRPYGCPASRYHRTSITLPTSLPTSPQSLRLL